MSPSAAPRAGRSARWLDQDPVSRTLLALYVGMFVVEAVGARSPWVFPPAQALALGAAHSSALFGEARYETLVTASFLHPGIVEAAFDALLVWQAGPVVERALGAGRMAATVIVAGVAGNAASAAHGWLANVPTLVAGASGSLAGLLAAAGVVAHRARDRSGTAAAPLAALLQWLAVLLVAGLVSRIMHGNIDPYALVGGALAGAAIGALWRRPASTDAAIVAALTVSAATLLASIAVVALRNRVDRFAALPPEDRVAFTAAALLDGRCGDAADGLRAVDRLRVPEASVAALRVQVQASCGRTESQPTVGPPSQRISP